MTYESTYFLTTLADAKVYLGIEASDTAHDSLCGLMLACVTYWMERYTNRKLKNRPLIEYYNGTGRNRLYLKNYPINSTTAEIKVYDDIDAAFGADTQFAAADLRIDSEAGMIALVNSVFSEGIQNVKVEHEAGYGHGTDPVPYDLVLTSFELLGYLWQRQTTKAWAHTGINIIQGGITILDSGAPKIVRDLLTPYVSHWKAA